MRHVPRILRDALRTWIDHDAFQQAGALAFFTLFSLAPLVIILVAIVGVVFGPEAASGKVAEEIRTLVGAQAAAAVEEAVRRSRPEEAGLWPTMLGIGALLFGATTVFAQMQSSLNSIWDVRASPARGGILNFLVVRLLSLGMVLIIGFLLLISFALGVAITATIEYLGGWLPVPALLVALVNLAASMLVTTALIGMLFKVLPDVLLAWQDVLEGALVTAVLFVVGQYLIAFYLAHVAPASTFGAAGSLVLLLLWVYYATLILLFGAAVTRAVVQSRRATITPRGAGVRVHLQVQEE
jgi:membrane protein